jgi:hypothetical protein
MGRLLWNSAFREDKNKWKLVGQSIHIYKSE